MGGRRIMAVRITLTARTGVGHRFEMPQPTKDHPTIHEKSRWELTTTTPYVLHNVNGERENNSNFGRIDVDRSGRITTTVAQTEAAGNEGREPM